MLFIYFVYILIAPTINKVRAKPQNPIRPKSVQRYKKEYKLALLEYLNFLNREKKDGK